MISIAAPVVVSAQEVWSSSPFRQLTFIIATHMRHWRFVESLPSGSLKNSARHA